MSQMTNAQAALQAAATVYSGGRGHTAPDHVKGMAASFKVWLDQQDRAEAPKVEEKPVTHWPTGLPMSPGGVLPSGGISSGDYLWEVDMRPRNNPSASIITVEVWAPSEQEAISKALSAKPGHSWGTPRRGQPSPEAVKPGPKHQRTPHAFGSAWCKDNCPPAWKQATTEQEWLGNSKQ